MAEADDNTHVDPSSVSRLTLGLVVVVATVASGAACWILAVTLRSPNAVAAQRIKDLEARLATTDPDECTRARSRVKELEGKLATTSTNIGRTEMTAAAWKRQVGELNNELATLRAKTARLERDIAANEPALNAARLSRMQMHCSVWFERCNPGVMPGDLFFVEAVRAASKWRDSGKSKSDYLEAPHCTGIGGLNCPGQYGDEVCRDCHQAIADFVWGP